MTFIAKIYQAYHIKIRTCAHHLTFPFHLLLWIFNLFIAKQIKYWNRSRAKRDFKESPGKDYGTHGLNQSHKLYYSFRLNFTTWRYCQKLHRVSSRGQKVRFFYLVHSDGICRYVSYSFFSSMIFAHLSPIEINWKPTITSTKWSVN